MRVFLDTNILLDVFLNRPGKPGSLQVLDACVVPGNDGRIAWHTLSNGFYIVRRETKLPGEAKRFASELLLWCNRRHRRHTRGGCSATDEPLRS